MLFSTRTEQLHTQDYVYAYNNDIHNFATIVFQSQQLFMVLSFLIKFKTLGLMVEPDLATKSCAKALSDRSLFEMSCRKKVIRPGT